jgi:hypothetical protein
MARDPESPFPGMDPYLERHWLPVHTQLVGTASRALNRQLPSDLVARPEEHLAVEVDEGGPLQYRRRLVVPDARVFESPASDASGATALVAPFKLVLENEPAKERSVRILSDGGERLLTVIEFVSPTNKTGEGADLFVAKRDELLDGGVNVVEIDFVRRGNWRRLLEPHLCPRDAVSTYRATVRIAGEPSAVYVYPMPLRAPLPPVPIPLRETDEPVVLDVQRLVAEVYADDRYGYTLDYTVEPSPPLPPDDAAWADELLRAAGRR